MKNLTPNWYKEPVSCSEIEKVESDIGYIFPYRYKEIVSIYDQLMLAENIFDFTNVYGKDDERDLNFISLSQKQATTMYDYKITSDPEYAGIPHLVAFGVCANGDYVCFDYREDPKGNNPKVVLMYHDDHIENEDGTLSMVVNFVANSFDEFMEMLHE
ncbi:SMI1/KNR4 family protein [Pasteurella atlantica]|uniref:SMI1/KNR4 family protein n=1 Tax=Pasteurellaceae TaxID=712 RepID=UPI00275932DD|nr:SMI1/KNR4 family protein [Pasteurella atlantica]MDP8034272.1 SMI1/KNR4 family protein [Pasteurella atlantica]MDP8036205.1 SMI1/KNR4 family protein [Pasteurella atlantica]MDP8038155.1 SMI1/KNR4 family protein [Pasteurella atlantica]MDP8048510.1 SMI1/KNR4 family protein [Pasteurella atlantica]MDP8050425.1 SMI1/KNR4 family protein [Pasteurella atlantica]